MPQTPENARLARERLKAAGICVNCGKTPAAAGKSACIACGSKRAAAAAKKRAVKREAGKCTKSGCQARAATASSMCETCQANEHIRKAEARRLRRSNGLCVLCGTPPVEGLTRCRRCADRDKVNRKKNADKREARGLCRNICRNPVTPGNKHCDECNRKTSISTSRRRNKLVATGLCGYCRTRPVRPGGVRCAECHTASAAKFRDRVARLRADRLCCACGKAPAAAPGTRCETCLAAARANHFVVKLAVLDAYGGPVCKCCGEEDANILQVDHVDGGGRIHRQKLGDGCERKGSAKVYRWLRDNGFPTGYQVLCPNCNLEKHRVAGSPMTRTKRKHVKELATNTSVSRTIVKRIKNGKCRNCANGIPRSGYRTCDTCIEAGKVRHAQLKLDVLQAYGGCQCAGCDVTNVQVLQIDHIGGGGEAHAREIGNGNRNRGRAKLYRWLKINSFPPGYRVLCASCNIRAKLGIPFPNATAIS